MVGIFSRFTSSSRSGHRRAHSATPSASEAAAAAIVTSMSTVPHGIEIATEFMPVERPSEPLDLDQPVQCPLPEPSILNDGRIWKERVSSVAQRRNDTPAIQEEQTSTGPDTLPRKPPPAPKGVILPSISAPEHNILKLLDECNASGIQSYNN